MTKTERITIGVACAISMTWVLGCLFLISGPEQNTIPTQTRFAKTQIFGGIFVISDTKTHEEYLLSTDGGIIKLEKPK